jgi:hypothetical protein
MSGHLQFFSALCCADVCHYRQHLTGTGPQLDQLLLVPYAAACMR